jgi:hypothetical protein
MRAAATCGDDPAPESPIREIEATANITGRIHTEATERITSTPSLSATEVRTSATAELTHALSYCDHRPRCGAIVEPVKDSNPSSTVRHPGDLVRLVIGGVLLTLCSWVASLEGISPFERSVFYAVNGLPSWLFGPLWVIMELGSLAAVFVVAAVPALWRRFRLALELVAGGLVAYYAANGLKDLVGRARPSALLGGW